MDHLAGGRYMLGIGFGGLPSDFQLFNIDPAIGQHREKFREALDIMLKIWTTDGGLECEGKYWKVSVPQPMYNNGQRRNGGPGEPAAPCAPSRRRRRSPGRWSALC